jgi:hypothetical protein
MGFFRLSSRIDAYCRLTGHDRFHPNSDPATLHRAVPYNLLSRVSYGILYDAMSVSDYVTSNGNRVDELAKIWKKAVVVAEIRIDRFQNGSLQC